MLGAVYARLEFERRLGTHGVLPLSAVPPPGQTPVTTQIPRAEAVQAPSFASSPPATRSAQPPPDLGSPQPPDREARIAQLKVLADEAAGCRACVLHERRKQAVFARGNPMAELVFVGEAPGRDEDARGLPFVGAAGQLLDKMVAAMGFAQEEIYICNVVKCRPPENRTPRPEEALACARFLRPQLQLVAPKIIVALGRCAAQYLEVARAEGPWRGRWGQFQGVPVMPTYHPAFLLRSPQFKKVVWQDLQQVMARFGRESRPRDSQT